MADYPSQAHQQHLSHHQQQQHYEQQMRQQQQHYTIQQQHHHHSMSSTMHPQQNHMNMMQQQHQQSPQQMLVHSSLNNSNSPQGLQRQAVQMHSQQQQRQISHSPQQMQQIQQQHHVTPPSPLARQQQQTPPNMQQQHVVIQQQQQQPTGNHQMVRQAPSYSQFNRPSSVNNSGGPSSSSSSSAAYPQTNPNGNVIHHQPTTMARQPSQQTVVTLHQQPQAINNNNNMQVRQHVISNQQQYQQQPQRQLSGGAIRPVQYAYQVVDGGGIRPIQQHDMGDRPVQIISHVRPGQVQYQQRASTQDSALSAALGQATPMVQRQQPMQNVVILSSGGHSGQQFNSVMLNGSPTIAIPVTTQNAIYLEDSPALDQGTTSPPESNSQLLSKPNIVARKSKSPIKMGNPSSSIAKPFARPVLGGKIGSKSQNGLIYTNGTSNENLLGRNGLDRVMKSIDEYAILEDEVSDAVLLLIDDFVDDLIEGSAALSKHRGSKQIQTKDIRYFLKRRYDMALPPDFKSEEGSSNISSVGPPAKRPAASVHQQRLALIDKSLKKL